jgi:hypothetical protein
MRESSEENPPVSSQPEFLSQEVVAMESEEENGEDLEGAWMADSHKELS